MRRHYFLCYHTCSCAECLLLGHLLPYIPHMQDAPACEVEVEQSAKVLMAFPRLAYVRQMVVYILWDAIF